jgi:hypothetical protein
MSLGDAIVWALNNPTVVIIALLFLFLLTMAALMAVLFWGFGR